jgi:hypothetical protein
MEGRYSGANAPFLKANGTVRPYCDKNAINSCRNEQIMALGSITNAEFAKFT